MRSLRALADGRAFASVVRVCGLSVLPTYLRRNKFGAGVGCAFVICVCSSPPAPAPGHRLRAGYAALLRSNRAGNDSRRLVRRESLEKPMPSRRDSCQQTRRARGRARSARVVAVHRKEADLDRFVAALLALAADPDCPYSGRRHKATGESRAAERTCRR